MTSKTLVERLSAALADNVSATPYKPDENPYANHDLTKMRQQKGVERSQDLHPALNMAAKAPGPMTQALEEERYAGIEEGRKDKSAQRMRAHRARAARKQQFDQIAASPKAPDKNRLVLAWRVVVPLHDTITKIAKSKKRWAERFLGSNVDDIAQVAMEQIALVLAKSDQDMGVLTQAADELGAIMRESGRVPGDQKVDLSDDERKHRRKVKKARKWLMGLVNNRVMGALADTFVNQRNLRWDNLDMIATIMASINGTGDDPMLARFKADRAPAFLGGKFPAPGRIDPEVMATAISAAITERGLDRMAELLLDEGSRRTDGAVKWRDLAQDVFLATPDGQGAWMWDCVVKATEGSSHKRKARAEAARAHARQQFEFLPSVVVGVVDALDWQRVGFNEGHAVMLNEFESYYVGDEHPLGRPSAPIRPALRFASPEAAARALVEHLVVLITGEDMITSAVNA